MTTNNNNKNKKDILYNKDVSVKPFFTPAVNKALNNLSIELSKKAGELGKIQYGEKPKRKVVNRPDYKKRNRTSRRRGYDFEYDLVKQFQALEHWNARRLGGSSTGLPDVVATRNPTETEFSTMMAIECKEGRDTYTLEVPADQIRRCMDTCNLLGAYHKQYVVFAFKFMKSEKLHRPSNNIVFYRFALNDPVLDIDRMIKASFDIRVLRLTFEYTTGKNVLGNLQIDGYMGPFGALIGITENQILY